MTMPDPPDKQREQPPPPIDRPDERLRQFERERGLLRDAPPADTPPADAPPGPKRPRKRPPARRRSKER